MSDYSPPLRDLRFVLRELLDVPAEMGRLPAFKEQGAELYEQVLEEGGRFCAERLAPLNAVGDAQGCRLESDATVRTPEGFKAAWDAFCEGGWPTLVCDPRFGGQGLPYVIGLGFQEMLNSANQAWAMYPGLTHGAYQCLLANGTEAQRALYLPRLVTGEWTGTMCLTEPHCGTDLGLLRTRAQPQDDGSYSITGTKIFISSGEHDLSANIVHLVLARMTDAPSGTRGISLFLVPKFVPQDDGAAGERNAVRCARLEEKMGIHGNATCVLDFDGARGWLVGEAHKGLAAMFVMMNTARVGVGVQSLGLMEAAYQKARAYAKERRQGRALSGPKDASESADRIIVHPDVRRMLLTQKAYVEGCRAFALWMGMQVDIAHGHPDADARRRAEDFLALLTPVVKAFTTDNGFLCSNLAMQVYGGHGYVRDNGVEQFVRDARINMIYEGTNTIQSLDLLLRKVLADQGARLRAFGALVRELGAAEAANPAMAEFIAPLADLGSKVEKLTMELGMKAFGDPDEGAAAAVDYLRVIGHFVLAYFWARMARVALQHESDADPFYRAKLATARFYFAKLLPETAGLMRSARAGAVSLMALDEDAF